ncbi:MAG TPA: HAD family hydrolase [Micromonosporaceae bacterium]|nr:HAD family hydrolase [Micromonosporaceae bacterium]
MSVLYVTDLDGTLLDSTGRVGPETVEIVNSLVAEGLWFTVATARAPRSALPLLDRLDLRLPLVFMNGALVIDPVTGQTVSRNILASGPARRVTDSYLTHGLRPFVHTLGPAGEQRVYYQGTGNACEEEYLSSRLAAGDDRFRLVRDFDAALDEAVLSLNVMDHLHRLDPLARALGADPDVFVHFGPSIHRPSFAWLEVCHPRANKGEAVRFVKEHVGADRLVCFGDNTNDIEMFVVADESYAVANAHPRTRGAATGVIGANDAHGVAVHLQATVRRSERVDDPGVVPRVALPSDGLVYAEDLVDVCRSRPVE